MGALETAAAMVALLATFVGIFAWIVQWTVAAGRPRRPMSRWIRRGLPTVCFLANGLLFCFAAFQPREDRAALWSVTGMGLSVVALWVLLRSTKPKRTSEP